MGLSSLLHTGNPGIRIQPSSLERGNTSIPNGIPGELTPLPWILDTPHAAYGHYTCRDTDAPSTPTTCPSFPQSLLLVLKFRSCSVAVLFPWGVSDSFSIQEKSLRRDPAPNPWIREGRVRVRGARHVCGWCLIITKATRK